MNFKSYRRCRRRRIDVGIPADISGAGATFPYPIYAKWADAYKKETGNGLNYQSIGSGGGIKQIRAKTVTFGASDMPLKPEQLEKDGLIQWPQAMGALVPVVNLEGIKPGELVFSGELLGDMYLGGRQDGRDDVGAVDCRLRFVQLTVRHWPTLTVRASRPAPQGPCRR
jgi:ABC-type phosphate transport system substrate-binding protein